MSAQDTGIHRLDREATMATLSHRERVVKALNHEEPDRVPRDLGGAATATIHVPAFNRLVKYLGLDEEARDIDRYLSTPSIPDSLLERFDIDCRRLRLGKAELSPEVVLDDRSYRDEWGVVWARSGEGHYINVRGPFQNEEPGLAELEKHAWPDPRDPGRIRGLKERAQQLHRENEYAVVLNLPYAIVATCQRVRGFAEWLEDLVLNPGLADALMEYSLMVSAGMAEFVLEEVGEYVDVVVFLDDLGFQDRCYVRPELYRERIKPYHRRLVEAIKSKTGAKVLLHSDGSVYSIIADLIDIGVDALNPVQVSAAGMDSRRLKEEFGADMSFWGGIDTHQVLPFGSPEDVRNEVKTRIQDMGPGGGYVLASVHNIQAEVPPENIVAMFDSALEYGRYERHTRT
jgi:uroporphyrinogen decarboxylase